MVPVSFLGVVFLRMKGIISDQWTSKTSRLNWKWELDVFCGFSNKLETRKQGSKFEDTGRCGENFET
jgi:hypothetical protein